jgi:flotillin
MSGEGLIAVALVILSLLAVLVIVITRQYHRVPPSEVMVVYGRQNARMITNGGVFIVPLIETYKKLDITIMTIKQEKDEVYTERGVPIKLDWVAQVQIDSEEAALRTAARAFLDKPRDVVRTIIAETLSANFRAIVGQLSVEEIHRDRDSFVQKVQDLARDDLVAMGIKMLSMGIEEITDDQGYLTAMAAPQIAAIKRDATIAEAEAFRESRVKSATAKREAEQAELDAEREILAQREALKIREVEVAKRVGLANATSEQEVQKLRALAVEQQQEAEVLVPARAKRQATEIEAEADRQKLTIGAQASADAARLTAQASADASRIKAEGEAKATEDRGRAEANALQMMKQAEANGAKAEAEAVQARGIAEAESEKAKLLAEAEGRRELAAASSAEGEINLRQFMIEQVTHAEIAKAEAIAKALAGLGGNVRMVNFGGNGSNGASGNSFLDFLMGIPEAAEIMRTKVEALSGDDFETMAVRISGLLNMMRSARTADAPPAAPVETTEPPKAQTPPPPPVKPKA